MLIGGAGADSFEFYATSPASAYQSTITDYEVGETLIVGSHIVSGLQANALPSEFSISHDANGDLVIDYTTPSGTTVHSITVEGITESDFFLPTIIDGTNAADVIAAGYVDADGDILADTYEAHVIHTYDGDDNVDLVRADNAFVDLGDGNDVFDGTYFTDSMVIGGGGDDTINLGLRSAAAEGGAGDDRLIGEAKLGATHTFTGGAGSDTFEFTKLSKNYDYQATITDYEVGEILKVGSHVISGLQASALPSDFSTSHDGNGDLVIDYTSAIYTAAHSITLEGITEADFFL